MSVTRRADWIQQILSGENYHDSTLRLTASLAQENVSQKAITELVRATMLAGRPAATAKLSERERFRQRYNDIPRLVSSASEKFNQAATQVPKPLSVEHILRNPPKPPSYHLVGKDGSGFLRQGIGGLISGPGGTGKTTLVLELAVAITTGSSWIDAYEAVEPTPVHLFTKEDDEDEIHRRVWKIFDRLMLPFEFDLLDTDQINEGSEVPRAKYEKLLRKNLHIYCLSGSNFPLTEQNGRGDYTTGSAVGAVVETVESCGGSGLVILDPLRKMSAGDETGAAMTAIVDACDQIRASCSGVVTTLLVHHTSQESMKTRDMNSSAIRGATDLVDGMRWVMILQQISSTNAKKLGIRAEDVGNYRQYSVPKSNYEAAKQTEFLQWHNGVFLQIDAESRETQSRTSAEIMAFPHLCSVVRDFTELGTPATARMIRNHCKANPDPETDTDTDTDKIPIAKNHEAVIELLKRAENAGLVEPYETKLATGQVGTAWRNTESASSLCENPRPGSR